MQLIEPGAVLVMDQVLANRGIMEFTAGGAFVAHIPVQNLAIFAGIYRLGNGNLLVTSSNLIATATGVSIITGLKNGGVFEVNTSGDLLQTEISGMGAQFIEFALIDSDGDGIGDAADGCPADPAKSSPGVCGCGTPDADTDGDTVPDCLDVCPAGATPSTPTATAFRIAPKPSCRRCRCRFRAAVPRAYSPWSACSCRRA